MACDSLGNDYLAINFALGQALFLTIFFIFDVISVFLSFTGIIFKVFF